MSQLTEIMMPSADESEGNDAGQGQRLLAGGLTGLICICATALYVLTPQLITNYRADVAFFF